MEPFLRTLCGRNTARIVHRLMKWSILCKGRQCSSDERIPSSNRVDWLVKGCCWHVMFRECNCVHAVDTVASPRTDDELWSPIGSYLLLKVLEERRCVRKTEFFGDVILGHEYNVDEQKHRCIWSQSLRRASTSIEIFAPSSRSLRYFSICSTLSRFRPSKWTHTAACPLPFVVVVILS